MHQGYILEWLDRLITISLNPAKTDLSAILEIQRVKIKTKIEEEKLKLKTSLKNMVFSFHEEKKIKLLVRKYHSGLVILLDQALENRMKCPAKRPELKQLVDDIVTCVDEMVSFIENRFFSYLNQDERVPSTYGNVALNEIRKNLDQTEADLIKKKGNKNIVDVLFFSLYSFIEEMKQKNLVHFSDIFYLKEVCSELGNWDSIKKTDGIYTPLDYLLINMNFNSKQYIDNVIGRLRGETNKCENIQSKLEALLFNFKAFKQMNGRTDVIFNPHCKGLNAVLENWFIQEIAYLKEKISLSGTSGSNESISQHVQGKKSKVLCILSTDQMGIILRAASELKILKARSMNEVFRSIVPHLSTPHKEKLSYDSMRSKSYAAETRDKEIAIETLEGMIEKIREY